MKLLAVALGCLCLWSALSTSAAGAGLPGDLTAAGIAFAEDGSIEQLTVGRSVPVRPEIPFYLQDVGRGASAFEPFAFFGRQDGALVYRAGEQYELRVVVDTVASAVRLAGTLQHLIADEEAVVRLRVALPIRFGEGDWTWSGALNERRPLDGDTMFRSVVPARTTSGEAGSVNSTAFGARGEGDVGHEVGSGQMSYYPFAAVNGEETGVSIGVDMALPLFYRLQAHPEQGLLFEYDTGLSPATDAFPNASRFQLYIYPHDPAWGLRSSAERYYRLFPEHFTKRVEKEGPWIPFVDVTDVVGYEDFGFAFLETGSTSRETAETQQATGVYTFPYTEPWDVQQGRRKDGLTYRREVERAADDPVLRELSTRDSRGQWMIRYMWAPWFDEEYAVSYTLNPDPELARHHGLDYVYENTVQPALAHGHSGIYFDSWEFKWMYDLNYRREHFAFADYPLVYSGSLPSPRPAIWNYTSEYEFGKYVADELHERGLLAMGNGFEWIPFTAGIMDLFGSEIDYTEPDVSRVEKWSFRRTIAAAKPIVLLLNTGLYSPPFVEPPYPGYDHYFQEALFYGFHPSFFSENASDDPYWRSRTHYEIGRPFFKRYVPLIEAVAEAGWQPVTQAHVRPATLGLERFGPSEDTVFFTLRNFSNYPSADYEMVVELAALGWEDADVAELIGEQPVEARLDGGRFRITGRVAPNATRLFRLTKRSAATPND